MSASQDEGSSLNETMEAIQTDENEREEFKGILLHHIAPGAKPPGILAMTPQLTTAWPSQSLYSAGDRVGDTGC